MAEKCVLCGSKIGSEYSTNWRGAWGDFGYFDRGFSTSHYICEKCYQHKLNLLNFDADEKEIVAAETYMTKHMEGKVGEIRNIVQGWINGESNNYFPAMQDLAYYVEGPEAYLFVFKDRAVLLSSLLEGMDGKKRINKDAVMLFPAGVNQSEFILFDDEEESYDEAEKLNYKPDATKKYGKANMSGFMSVFASLGGLISQIDESLVYDYEMNEKGNGVRLQKSLGDYGSLEFLRYTYQDEPFSFQFFYYQNRLMEEVYNYIQSRLAISGKEEKEEENPKGNASVALARRAKAKADAAEEGKGNATFSLSEELTKLKGLVDCGILTQEEFDEAKKKLISKL